MSQELPKEIFDALKENNEVLLETTDVLKEIKDDNEETIYDKNIINKKESVRTILTPDEKKRYSLIGEEFFKSFFKKLQKLKNDENMLIKDDVESINKNIEKQYKEKVDESEKSGASWADILLLATITFALLKDTIISFFETAKKKFDDFIKRISKPFDNLSFDSILTALKELVPDIRDIIDTIKKAFNALVTKIKEEAEKGWKIISDGWAKIWDRINFDSVMRAIKKAFGAIPQAIVDALKGLINMISELFNLDGEDTPPPDKPDESELKKQQDVQMALGAFFLSMQGQVKTTEEIIKDVNKMVDAWMQRASKFGLGKDAINEKGELSETKVKETYEKYVTDQLVDLLGHNKKTEGSPGDIEFRKKIQELVAANRKHIGNTGFDEDKRKELIESAMKLYNLDSSKKDEVEEGIEKQIQEANNVLFGQANAVKSLLLVQGDINDNNAKTAAAALAAARAQGLEHDFMFLEARSVIFKSLEEIKKYFTDFESTLNNNITREIKEGFKNLKLPVNLTVEPVVNEDNSSHTFVINALDETKIKLLNDKLTELNQQTVEELKNQNATLEKIKKLLEEKKLSSSEPAGKSVVVNQPAPTNDGADTGVGRTGVGLQKQLGKASGFA